MRVILLKNVNCISLADLGLRATSLKLQLVSHNPLPSQQLSESQRGLARGHGRVEEGWRGGSQEKVQRVTEDVGIQRCSKTVLKER